MITSLDHIGISVHDIEASIELYRKLFDVKEFHRETVQDQGVHIASFFVGSVRLELTAPIDQNSSIVKFLNTRGEGIHHIAFKSDAIEQDLKRLSDNEIRLVNEVPAKGAHEMLIAFLHPKSTGGVLIELCTESSSQ